MFNSVRELEAYMEKREKIGIKPGLSRMERLCQDLFKSKGEFPSIHVSGTNGKGSTVTYLASILDEAGYRVGTFISPSITNRQAMIQLNGQPISDRLYLNYANKIGPKLIQLDQEDNSASPFEMIVAISYYFFTDHADISIIETGMGGLEDATNVINPLTSIITSIDYDHTGFLGEMIEEIAHHKAGIIKENKPVVVGDLSDLASSVIEREALAKYSPINRLNVEFKIVYQENQPYYQEQDQQIPLHLRLQGDHQLQNSALAIKASLLLNEKGFQISEQQIEQGIRKAELPARFEQINDHPTIIIDGAHNPASIRAFINTVKKLYPEVNKRLIFAVFKDKSSAEMIQLLEPYFDEIIFTSFDHERAEQSDRLYEASNHANKKISTDWQATLDQIIDQPSDQKRTFVVGSLDFVGRVRRYIID